jgi:hypothetical protein
MTWHSRPGWKRVVSQAWKSRKASGWPRGKSGWAATPRRQAGAYQPPGRRR